jgi:hypothetical protein
MLRLAAWRVRSGVPSRAFYRLVPSPNANQVMSPAELLMQRFLGTRAKPAYVDFESPLHVRAFARAMRHGDASEIVFEEVLPSPDDSMLVGLSGAQVAELVVEFDRPSATWSTGA